MTSRFRLALFAGFVALAGCSNSYNAGPISYSTAPELAGLEQPKIGADGKAALLADGKPEMTAQSELRRRVTSGMKAAFGDNPQQIRVPKGSGLLEGGAWLADHAILLGKDNQEPLPVGFPEIGQDGMATKRSVLLEGGYSLYRKHCLHCHGVSGDGGGPTASFLWPRPRDYRKGLFKFTSTTGQKPTRDDLHRVLVNGIANSSMPSFEALMNPNQLQQVIDYVIFLSARGQTEQRLILEASSDEEPKTSPTADDQKKADAEYKTKAEDLAVGVFDSWKSAESEVLRPLTPRTPATQESILRGKKLFLGQASPKLECAGCHGPRALGNGPSFVPYSMFREVVFGGDPELQDNRLEVYLEQDGERAIDEAEPELAKEPAGDREKKTKAVKEARINATRGLWKGGSLDDWKNPLRPANINNGTQTMYKGGRRPIDIYWRIAKGINGAKMPAHASLFKDHPEQMWDLVNFVLALPYQPGLLDDAPDEVAPAATTPTPTVSK